MDTTVFHLVRHGHNDVLHHSIAGRAAGVNLNSAGLQEAAAVADYLCGTSKVSRILSSPLERATQTAAPLVAATGIKLEISEALLEVDFGEWTGKPVRELNTQEQWRKWNTFRSAHRVPGGESMLEVQARVVANIERLRRESPGATLALFSHGDPIRAAILYYLGMSLDFIHRLEVNPGSISTLVIDDWGSRLRALNILPCPRKDSSPG